MFKIETEVYCEDVHSAIVTECINQVWNDRFGFCEEWSDVWYGPTMPPETITISQVGDQISINVIRVDNKKMSTKLSKSRVYVLRKCKYL